MELHGTWLSADLVPLRHITADLVGRIIVGIWVNPWQRCMVVHNSWWGVKPTSCRWLWWLYPFLLTCWILEGWKSLAQPHEHAVRTLNTSLFHVSCSKHPSGCLGMTVHMDRTPLHQIMHSAVAVSRIHMLLHLIELILLCWLWHVIIVLLWAVGGQVPHTHTHHGLSLTSNLLWDHRYGCG